MPEDITNFLISKGTLGVLCFLLILALGIVWKVWRDDTKAFGAERTALNAELRNLQTEYIKRISAMSDELKTVLVEIKTNIALMLNQRT